MQSKYDKFKFKSGQTYFRKYPLYKKYKNL